MRSGSEKCQLYVVCKLGITAMYWTSTEETLGAVVLTSGKQFASFDKSVVKWSVVWYISIDLAFKYHLELAHIPLDYLWVWPHPSNKYIPCTNQPQHIYRPLTDLWAGNVFSRVCLSVHRGYHAPITHDALDLTVQPPPGPSTSPLDIRPGTPPALPPGH